MSGINLNQLSINIDQQSTLAKLLAQENISVIHGNYRTAWFDPQKRVLALPIFKNRGKAVYDLLTGHEVGHALYTPAKGWHSAIDDIDGAPKAYLNILEDVRIERKIQDRYPGLRAQFKKAYKILADEDFFGVSQYNGDYDKILLIDRINLFYKLSDKINLGFASDSEYNFVMRAFKTESFDDVVELAKEIYAYQKELYKQQSTEDEQSNENQSDEEYEDESSENNYDSDLNDYHKPDKAEDNENSENFDDKQESTSENKSDESTSENKSDESEENISTSKSKSPDQLDDDTLKALDSVTDQAFRDHEHNLLADNDVKNTMVYTINKVDSQEILIGYKEYYNQWKNELALLPAWKVEDIQLYIDRLADKFKKFKSDTEAAAAYMAKEFELRKAAYQYSRSSIHKTGVINTNKLHSYKYSEDIFMRSTKLANYKNHGMMMFIDFSGSMLESIGPTIRQILNLTSFCRMVHIPYEVYAFTTRVKHENLDIHTSETLNVFSDCEIIPQKFNLLNLMSSQMTRSEFNESFRMLWNLSQSWDCGINSSYITSWNRLHSTPLNTCIAFANDHIKAFKAKHGIEKMITMFLTDGASDNFQIRTTREGEKYRTFNDIYRHQGALVRFAGNIISVNNFYSPEITAGMLKTIKKNTESIVLGFFISQYRNDAVRHVCKATSISFKDKYAQQIAKNRVIVHDDIFGYDRYFGLCNKNMDVIETEFGDMVEDGASTSKLKTSFTKMSKAKRVNRIFLNAFVDAIA